MAGRLLHQSQQGRESDTKIDVTVSYDTTTEVTFPPYLGYGLLLETSYRFYVLSWGRDYARMQELRAGVIGNHLRVCLG